MPMETAGLPFNLLSVSLFADPSSVRATSRIRSTDPSGLARMTMSPNCDGVVKRPCVCTLSWNCVASLVGRAPMRPTAACTF